MKKRGAEDWQIIIIGEVLAFVLVFFALISAGQRLSQHESIDREIQVRDTSLYLNTILSLPGNILLSYPQRPDTKLSIQSSKVLIYPAEQGEPKIHPFTRDLSYDLPEISQIPTTSVNLLKDDNKLEVNNGLSSTLEKLNCYGITTKDPNWKSSKTIAIHTRENSGYIYDFAQSLGSSLSASGINSQIFHSFPEQNENIILISLKSGTNEKLFFPTNQRSSIKKTSKLFCFITNELNFEIDYTEEEHPFYEATFFLELKQDSNFEFIKNSIKKSLEEYYK